jgi:hypothetical protein
MFLVEGIELTVAEVGLLPQDESVSNISAAISGNCPPQYFSEKGLN